MLAKRFKPLCDLLYRTEELEKLAECEEFEVVMPALRYGS
jgi:hypothetical protein